MNSARSSNNEIWIVVVGRHGNMVMINFCEHHCNLKIRMSFRLDGRRMIFDGYKSMSIGDWSILNMRAQGFTDRPGMQIGYSWTQSGRKYKNSAVTGTIEVTRDN